MDKLRPCLGVLLLLLTGCVPFQANGTRHIMIVGFGIVSVPATNAPNTQVTKTQAIGLILSDQPGTRVGIGYSSSTVIQVSTNQNTLIEVSDRPGQSLKVKTQ